MSVLDWPRLNFSGIFRANPCTANNDDVEPDVVHRDTNTLGSSVADMDDEQIRAFLRQGVKMANFDDERGTCRSFIRGGWNLFGDHMTNFDDAVVTSFVDERGVRSSDPALHPLIGTHFQLLGAADPKYRRTEAVMCDLDPTGLVTTQIFIGGAAFTLQDGQQLVAWNHDTRAYQNWLNFSSTVGRYEGDQNFVGIGCIFQFVVPASALQAQLSQTTHAGVRRLLQAGAAEAGLVVRFRVFEVEPAITDEELAQHFARGQGTPNPAYGYVVGTIGIHRLGEPETEPAGRKLTVHYPRPEMNVGPPSGQADEPICVPAATSAWECGKPPALVGNVVVLVRKDPAVITLDMAGAFPKWGYRNPKGPPHPSDPFAPPPGFDVCRQQGDVGALSLWCDTEDGRGTFRIGALNYGLDNYDDYQNWGGLQDLPYDPAQYDAIVQGTLRIASDAGLNAGVSLLHEDVIRLVTDARGVYLSGPGDSSLVELRAYQRGGPLQRPLQVTFKEYVNIIQTRGSAPVCVDGYRPNQTTDLRAHLQQPNRLQVLYQGEPVDSVTLGPDTSAVTLTLQGVAPGVALMNYQLGSYIIDPSVPAWSTQCYSSVRVYSVSDYANLLERKEIPWATVYEEVLRYYYVLFPAMSTFIPLNHPDGILDHATAVKDRLGTPDSRRFYTSLNMPLTHSLSPSKVALLNAWIDQQLAKLEPKGHRS